MQEETISITDEEIKQHINAILSVLDDKKALDLHYKNVSSHSSTSDYYLVCTGNSRPHTRSLSEAVLGYIKDHELPYHIEGRGEGIWILIDMGFAIIHIMQEDQRQYYNLEQLWQYGQINEND